MAQVHQRQDGSGRGSKILLVDDEPDAVEFVSRAFLRSGYKVITASDGERALELMASARPDLIVLDVLLPRIDGFEVCRRIRLESQVPIIMLTARDEEDDIMRGFRLGVDDYVTKPFSVRLLTARVAAVLCRTAEASRRNRGDHIAARRHPADGHGVRRA